MLTPEDVAQPSNATRTVDCEDEHTAETFAVGDLPDELEDAAYDAEELGAFAYKTCSAKFQKFLGADESTVMRTIVSWAWFRPSEKAWEKGARWYRCDIVGGGEQSKDVRRAADHRRRAARHAADRRRLDGLRQRRVGAGGAQDRLHGAAQLARGDRRSRSATRPTPTPATAWSR